MVNFERGCGGAEQCLGAKLLCQHDGRIARMIAWGRLLLLIALLMLFVHDDEAELLEGEEDAGAYT